MPSYAEERRIAVTAINARNKKRAKEMERRVAKYLEGRRIPYSGSGVEKGDCKVKTDKVGHIFIECKLSAAVYKGDPLICVKHQWFEKMNRDYQSMRAKFPALVLHYQGRRFTDYVIVPISAVEIYGNVSDLVGLSTIDSTSVVAFRLLKSVLDAALGDRDMCLYQSRHGRYVLMTIELFKEMIHGNTDICESRGFDTDNESGTISGESAL